MQKIHTISVMVVAFLSATACSQNNDNFTGHWAAERWNLGGQTTMQYMDITKSGDDYDIQLHGTGPGNIMNGQLSARMDQYGANLCVTEGKSRGEECSREIQPGKTPNGRMLLMGTLEFREVSK